MTSIARQRHQRARVAIHLGQWGWTVAQCGLVLALMLFCVVLGAVVLVAHPTHWLPWLAWGQRGCLVVGVVVLARLAVFRAGWLPVRPQDLATLKLRDQPMAVQEALARLWDTHGWLTWGDVWQVLPRPRAVLDWPCQWQWATRGKKGDRLTSRRDMAQLGLTPVAQRLEAQSRREAVATPPPRAARPRART